jgi:hypothetical protein
MDASGGNVRVVFCDLCNESVPFGDIDRGAATLVKGRVVCATCNQSMHAARASESAASAMGAFRANAPAAAVSAPAAPVAHGARRERGSGVGVVLGVFAIGAAGAVAWMAFERAGETQDALLRQVLSNEARDQQQAVELAAVKGDVRRELEAVREDTAHAVADTAEGLATRWTQTQAQHAQLEDALRALRDKLAIHDAARMEVERHDAELLALHQRVAVLESALAEARTRIEELSAGGDAPIADGPSEPAPPQRPAWFGLTEKLQSASTTERWQAILALAETKDAEAAPYLVPCLKDADVFIRVRAAQSLGDLGHPGTVEALIACLDDAESVVRDAAYMALRAITKRDLPFDAQTSDAQERQRRIRAWREWWDKERSKFGA